MIVSAAGTLTPTQCETFIEHLKATPLLQEEIHLLEPITLQQLAAEIVECLKTPGRVGVGVVVDTKGTAERLRDLLRRPLHGGRVLLLLPGCLFDSSDFDELLFELGTEKLSWWDEAVRPCLAGLARPPLGFTLKLDPA
jgi:hypothetical protein